MSDEENSSNPLSSVVLVDQASSRRKPPYCVTELQDDIEMHKYTTVPATPDISSDKHKEFIKAVSANLKKLEHAPESIALSSLENDKGGTILHSSLPIPPDVPSVRSVPSDTVKDRDVGNKDGNESLIEETVDVQPAEPEDHSEWSDEEEAGGLPRSESRASRVSRAVRQLFCCGVSYEAASEENLPSQRRAYSQAI